MKRDFWAEQTYNKIYVCEALPDGELSTGIQLARDTLKLPCDIQEVAMGACQIHNKEEFMTFMNQVKSQVREQGIFPIIHLEIHGLNDKSGLWLPSNEKVGWNEFSDVCREINAYCLNNLLVVLAVCYGFQAVFQASIKKLTPFFSLIGPSEKVYVQEIKSVFPKFYQELLCSGDLKSAFSMLGNPYLLYLCEDVFAKNVITYIKNYCRGKENLIRPDEGKLERIRINFLMADHPKNKNRFTLTIDDMIELAFTDQ